MNIKFQKVRFDEENKNMLKQSEIERMQYVSVLKMLDLRESKDIQDLASGFCLNAGVPLGSVC